MSAIRSAFHEQLHLNPNFGYDAWLGPNAPADARAELASRLAYNGADTLAGDIGLLPVGLNVYASYVDNFGGWPELIARFGSSGAFLLSITIFGGKARCADVEPGAMSVDDFPGWLHTNAIIDPLSPVWLYTNAANLETLKQRVGNWRDKFGRRPIWWAAHFGHGPHVCGPATCGYSQADWTQWADSGPAGENFDRSIGYSLPPGPPPHPPVSEEFMDIETAQNAAGVLHLFVVPQDGSHIWYSWQKGGAWHDGSTSVRVAGLVPFAPAPAGRKFVTVAAHQNDNGNLVVIAGLDDGRTVYTWQRKGESGWAGGQPGHSVAGFSNLTPPAGKSTF